VSTRRGARLDRVAALVDLRLYDPPRVGVRCRRGGRPDAAGCRHAAAAHERQRVAAGPERGLSVFGQPGSKQNRAGRWPSFVRGGGGRTRAAAPAGIPAPLRALAIHVDRLGARARMATHALAALTERRAPGFGLRLGWQAGLGKVKRHLRALSCARPSRARARRRYPPRSRPANLHLVIQADGRQQR
jgi:hypothetical protein